MGRDGVSLVKVAALSIILLSVYTALSISRLPPSLLALTSSILLVVGYILLSFNIIWIMKIEWKHLIAFIVLSGINGLVGLVDIASLYMILTVTLVLVIGRAHTLLEKHTVREILGNKYVIAMISTYYIIASITVLARFTPILPETLGLAEVRRILSITLVSKIFYTFASLFVVALVYVLYRDVVLFSGGVELRRRLIRELVELAENVVRGRDVYYMFIVEVMLLIAGVLVYPIILFFLARLHLFIGGLIYIIGIILTYISWIMLRTLAYGMFSTSNMSMSEAKKTLLCVWTAIIAIILVLAINPSTTSIVASMIKYPTEHGQLVSLFNRFYTSIVDLEFNAVKLLVELLWG